MTESKAISLPGIINFRYVPPLFITLILLTGHFTFGMLESYYAILLAIFTSMLTEIALAKAFTGKMKNLASAYITGISVGILIRTTFLWPFALAAALSIMSKYILRFHGRHIWNPSNFGISWMLMFSPFSVAGLSIQWGNNFLPMIVIWLLGLFIVWRVKRLHITLTYVAAFIFFAWLRTLLTGDHFLSEIAPLTGPMYQLFIFFMITDPATTVKGKKGQIAVVLLIAFVEFILRMNEIIYAPFYSLFIVGPIAMVIDIQQQILKGHKQRKSVQST